MGGNFFTTGKISPEREIQKQKIKWFWRFSIAKSE
jgi:hypothetical protein